MTVEATHKNGQAGGPYMCPSHRCSASRTEGRTQASPAVQASLIYQLRAQVCRRSATAWLRAPAAQHTSRGLHDPGHDTAHRWAQ